MPSKITSLTNPKIKEVVHLRTHRRRGKNGLTIVEGYREVSRALEAGVHIRELYICREFFKAVGVEQISATSSTNLTDFVLKHFTSRNIPVYEATRAVFSKIAYGERKEGILGICQPVSHALADLRLTERPLLLLIEGVEKPGNLGAILRSCDGTGIEGVIVCDQKTDLYNPNVIRASLGTVFSVKVMVSTNEESNRFLKSKKIQICATSPMAKTVYTQANFNIPVAIVLGSEQKGLSEFWQRHADFKVRIPMKGSADSLNVSSSAAVLLYEAVRQRG